jgi:hypothetical protein
MGIPNWFQNAANSLSGGLAGAGLGQQAATGVGWSNAPSGPYPGQLMPTPYSGPTYPPYIPQVMLSDYDIELMAVCIANQHPQVEGKAACFCMLKRLEKGISKD